MGKTKAAKKRKLNKVQKPPLEESVETETQIETISLINETETDISLISETETDIILISETETDISLISETETDIIVISDKNDDDNDTEIKLDDSSTETDTGGMLECWLATGNSKEETPSVDEEKEKEKNGTERITEAADYKHNVNNIKKLKGSTKMRLLLFGNYCGAVIGKGGENLDRLRKEHNVALHMQSGRTNERVLHVDGDQDGCISLVKELLTICPQAPYANTQKCAFEINLLIATVTVGMIIGKSGTKLKEIRDQSNGKVKVYRECLPKSNERVIAIGSDSGEDLLYALRLILDVVNDAPRGPCILYDPNNKASENLGAGTSLLGITPIASQGYLLCNNVGTDHSSFQQLLAVTILTISHDMCGAIIGKGGNKIREIRSTSGAKVEFSEPDRISKADRVITISGMQQQVNLARQLMRQSVQNRSF